MSKKLTFIYIVVTVFLFSFRVFVFASNYGGVEHDSGWYLGVARNFAQRGIYASYTNTVIQEGVGDYPSLHGRYSVQDENGFTYFPAGVTVGPGYVFPQALLLKIFGYDFWQFRLWPLITFIGMLALLFYFAYKLGGFLSLIIFQAWLWLFPQIYTQMAYEAYGEHIALFFILLSFFVFLKKKNSERTNFVAMFVSGAFLSFSVLTKYLSLLSAAGFCVILVYDIFRLVRGKAAKNIISGWLFWILGFILPLGLFEIYKYLTLVSKFGIDGWTSVNKDFELHFKSNGSGLSLKEIDLNFIQMKMLVWNKAGFKLSWLPWLGISFSAILAIKRKFENNSTAFTLFYFATISGLLWFLLFSTTGWTRHAWISLVLGFTLFSAFIGKLFVLIPRKFQYFFIPALVLLFIAVVRFDRAFPQMFLRADTIEKWETNRYEEGLQGLPTNTIFSFKDQAEIKDYFSKNITDGDRIYYLGWFLVSEVSPLVDKVFYSYDRYEYLGKVDLQGGVSYLIFGPYQKGRLSLVGQSYVPNKKLVLCKKVVFENPSYTLCILRSDVDYENNAYE